MRLEALAIKDMAAICLSAAAAPKAAKAATADGKEWKRERGMAGATSVAVGSRHTDYLHSLHT